MADDIWYAKYLHSQGYDELKKRFNYRYAYRFRDADGAFAEAIEKLLLLKLPNVSLRHTQNTDAFVRVCFDRTVVDICRQENGRLQAPLKLRSKGPAHRELFLRHCLGRLSAKEISRLVGLSVTCVRHWIRWLDQQRACERRQQPVGYAEPDAIADTQQVAEFEQRSSSSVERELELAERRALVNQLLGVDELKENIQIPPKLSSTLSNEQILILRMHYYEDKTLVAAARALNKPTHRIKYLHRTAIARLRDAISEYALDVQ